MLRILDDALGTQKKDYLFLTKVQGRPQEEGYAGFQMAEKEQAWKAFQVLGGESHPAREGQGTAQNWFGQ